jgi:hypothetical protein
MNGCSQHRTKSSISRDGFSRAARFATVICGRLAVSERESDKQALAHWVFSVGHALQCLLLIMNLLILRHVRLIAEIIEITSIGLRVQFRDKGCTLRTKGIPINFGEVLVTIDILD